MKNKKIMKISLCTYAVLVITLLVFCIIGMVNKNLVYKYPSQYVLISLFVIPIMMWSFGKTLVDINCMPKFIEIKNQVADKSNDEKVDAYFDFLEEQGFSIFAPFVLLGVLIGSGFLYGHTISNFVEQEFTLNFGVQILFHVLNCLCAIYFITSLIKIISSKNKKILNIVVRILTIIGYITSIVLSFNSDHLLFILSVASILGTFYRSMFAILKKSKSLVS